MARALIYESKDAELTKPAWVATSYLPSRAALHAFHPPIRPPFSPLYCLNHRKLAASMSMALSTVINAHRMASYAVFSSSLVALVVVNGFRKHSNFYSIAVYLSRSNGSVLVSTMVFVMIRVKMAESGMLC